MIDLVFLGGRNMLWYRNVFNEWRSTCVPVSDLKQTSLLATNSKTISKYSAQLNTIELAQNETAHRD